MRFLDYKDQFKVLTIERAIRCIGMKDNSRDIKSEKGSWRRVWFGNYTENGTTNYPRVVATPVIMLRDKGKEIIVNAQVLEYGLVFYQHDERMVGMMNYHGDRRDIPFKWFRVSGRNPLYRHEGYSTTELSYSDKCTELIAITKCGNCWSSEPQAQLGGYWGSGGLPCKQEPTLINELYYGHENLVVDDQTRSWWRATVDFLKEELSSLWHYIFGTITIDDWQGMILTLLCIYYLSYLVVKNHWLSLALTVTYCFSRYFG